MLDSCGRSTAAQEEEEEEEEEDEEESEAAFNPQVHTHTPTVQPEGVSPWTCRPRQQETDIVAVIVMPEEEEEKPCLSELRWRQTEDDVPPQQPIRIKEEPSSLCLTEAMKTEGETREMLYSCDVCGKCFSGNYDLKTHRVTHTGEKPFGCAIFGKYLSESSVVKSTSAVGNTPPMRRRSYTAAFKLEVIKYAEENSNRAAERKFSINEKLARDWRKQKDFLLSMKKTKKANRGKKPPTAQLQQRPSEDSREGAWPISIKKEATSCSSAEDTRTELDGDEAEVHSLGKMDSSDGSGERFSAPYCLKIHSVTRTAGTPLACAGRGPCLNGKTPGVNVRLLKRRSYTAAFKLEVVKYAEEESKAAALKKFGISEKLVRDWRKQKDFLQSVKKTKKANRGMKPRWTELEDRLESWFVQQRAAGFRVSTIQLRLKSQEMAKELGILEFKGGPSWCFRFMKRKKLSIRTRTEGVERTGPQRPHLVAKNEAPHVSDITSDEDV